MEARGRQTNVFIAAKSAVWSEELDIGWLQRVFSWQLDHAVVETSAVGGLWVAS